MDLQIQKSNVPIYVKVMQNIIFVCSKWIGVRKKNHGSWHHKLQQLWDQSSNYTYNQIRWRSSIDFLYFTFFWLLSVDKRYWYPILKTVPLVEKLLCYSGVSPLEGRLQTDVRSLLALRELQSWINSKREECGISKAIQPRGIPSTRSPKRQPQPLLHKALKGFIIAFDFADCLLADSLQPPGCSKWKDFTCILNDYWHGD